jgi:hypothetical protein
MRFTPFLAVIAVAVSGAVATPFDFDLPSIIGSDISQGNHYGAPTPPWNRGKPGWYFGKNPSKYPKYPCLTGVCYPSSIYAESYLLTVDSFQVICKILTHFPHALQCPTKPPQPTPTSTSTTPSPTPTVPADGYTQTFSNLTAAVQADDYMTFGLVDTVAGEYSV